MAGTSKTVMLLEWRTKVYNDKKIQDDTRQNKRRSDMLHGEKLIINDSGTYEQSCW